MTSSFIECVRNFLISWICSCIAPDFGVRLAVWARNLLYNQNRENLTFKKKNAGDDLRHAHCS